MASICEEGVDAALRNVAHDVVYEGESRWNFFVSYGSLPASLSAVGGWLRFSAAIPDSSDSTSISRDHRALLRINSCLEGSMRSALPPWKLTPRLIADLHVDGMDLATQVLAGCGELTDAVRFVETWDGELPTDSPGDPAATEDVARACEEHGWECRAGSAVTIRLSADLKLSQLASTVEIETSPSGAALARVTLAQLTDWPPECVHAAAVLLMRVSGAVRSVKGVIGVAEPAETAALVAPIDGPLDRGLDRALSALTVACRMSGRELLALRDERVAARYLELFTESHQRTSHGQMEEQVCLQQL